MIPSLFNGTIGPSTCSSSSIQFPALHGAELFSLEANVVSNYTQEIGIRDYANHGATLVQDITFCNVSVFYGHPGRNDSIHVEVWLPIDSWNGRLQAVGGGGWQAGMNSASILAMSAAVGEGYSAVSTDAGLGSQVFPIDWALVSEGNVNLGLLQNLASVSLNDMAVIGKGISKSFYGQAPTYSYFSGCSQGGRQGLMLAQRYPNAFDGIAASAPGINWSTFFVNNYWPTLVMDRLGVYPPQCEFEAITAAAIRACDGDDGLVDGIISDPQSCQFEATSMIGRTINCTSFTPAAEWKISSAAVTIVNEAWTGAKKPDNSSIWFGISKDAPLTGSQDNLPVVGTACTTKDVPCTRSAEGQKIWADWMSLFVLKNSSAEFRQLTYKEFARIAHASANEYDSIISTNDPDLSAFKERGGKMITYHGLADILIPPLGSQHYYEAVTALDPSVHDFYRLFLAPGLQHCYGGNGAYPDTTFDSLRLWVEDGIVPDSLNATTFWTTPVTTRPLCPYPKKQVYLGGGSEQRFGCQ